MVTTGRTAGGTAPVSSNHAAANGTTAAYLPSDDSSAFVLTVVVAALLTAVICGACSGPASPSGLENTALTAELIGGSWTLETHQPPGQPPVAPPAGAVFCMQIAGGLAAITADCNRCNGPAVVGVSTLTVGPLMACTRAFCASAPFDDAFLRMLAGESEAAIDGKTLTLRSDRGVLRFRR